DSPREVGARGIAESLKRRTKFRILKIATYSTTLQVLNLQHLAVGADIAPGLRVQAHSAVRIGGGCPQAENVRCIEQDKQRMVEDVEHICLQLHPHLLPDRKRLDKRHIEANVRTTFAGVSNQVSVDKLEVNQIAGKGVD